jgi:hypothetical protein
MMFEKDEKIIRDFVMLRLLLVVTFVGLFVMWMTFFGWVVWRLGPGGYSATEAQIDRSNLCDYIDREFVHEGDGGRCPKIMDDH